MKSLVKLLIAGLLLAQSSSVNAGEEIQRRIDEMRKSGASQTQIISAMERFQASEADVTVGSWTQWTNYYKVKILNPPVSFCNLDECKMDFTTPTSAYRAYKRAVLLLDEPTLLKYADDSGTSYLKEGTLRNSKSAARKNAPITPTRITLLLTAETTVSGKDYLMVLSREQNAKSPTNGLVFLQKYFFVYDKTRNAYLFTRDVESSSLAEILPAAKAAETGIAKYPAWMDKMKKSLFPAHFYEME